MPKSLIPSRAIKFGCDPEVFVSYETGRVRKRQSIVGSEVVLPPHGINLGIYDGKVVCDGVQIELQPTPEYCRANVSNSLQKLFRELDYRVKARALELKRPLTINFDQVVRLSKGDLHRLSGDAQMLACNPSKNIYGRRHVIRDGHTYLYRSGAGHIHMGIDLRGIDPVRFVQLLDTIVGVMCVLVDRDPLAALRRKTYGRAGEYRLPKYGLEYRTPSNFWLQNYKLMGMVMGLAKIAWQVATSGITQNAPYPEPGYIKDADQRIMEKVDLEQVETAINTNDWELANDIYRTAIRPVLADIVSTNTGVDCGNVENFDFFVGRIRAAELAGAHRPLDVWFPEDPRQHWLTKPEGHNTGFESFLKTVVEPQRIASAQMRGVVQFPAPAANLPDVLMPTPVDVGNHTDYANITLN